MKTLRIFKSRMAGETTKQLLEFFVEGKKGKAIILATPDGNFLSPKAVKNKVKEELNRIIKEIRHERDNMLDYETDFFGGLETGRNVCIDIIKKHNKK